MDDRPPDRAASQQAVARFRDDRFGLFVHWGIYSVLARGEWVMHREQIPAADYEPLAERFTAERFDAADWAELASAAGQRYLVITSKHHDGFCMWDTDLDDYKVTARTPFGRDVLAELADACRDAGVRLGFYHSLLDWHHRAYEADWPAYVDHLHGQVRELCTRFGPICEMWFDGHWPNHRRHWYRPTETWRFGELYDMIHELQPDCVIGNNHHSAPLAGEDFQIYEQDPPGANEAGFNPTPPGSLPLEACFTMNRSWGWNGGDDDYKSVEELCDLAGRLWAMPCNLLLNVGPRPDGLIPAPQAERLREMGRRMPPSAAGRD
jgi:alpha-L-fucosidase